VRNDNRSAAIEELRARFGPALAVDSARLAEHAKDVSRHKAHAPDAVVYPTSTQEVAEVVRICAAHRVPIIRHRDRR
jgi:D-lactate dehydrogenase (cytochrome)